MESYEEKYALIQHEACCQSYRDSNKFAMEFSKMTLRGAFWLNGACVVPIIYSKVTDFYAAALWFAGGAFAAALATGAAYIVQMLIMASWAPFLTKRVTDPFPKHIPCGFFRMTQATMDKWRLFPTILLLTAYVCFGVGLWEAKGTLTAPTKAEQSVVQLQQEAPRQSPEAKTSDPSQP